MKAVDFTITLRCPHLGVEHTHTTRTATRNPDISVGDLMYRFDQDELKYVLADAVHSLLMKGVEV